MSVLIKGTNIEDLQRAMLMFSGHEIVELPDHGDLIDRDALLLKVQKWYWEALETVKRMPAVIPAERSEDGN